jgi:hypothetical protein
MPNPSDAKNIFWQPKISLGHVDTYCIFKTLW